MKKYLLAFVFIIHVISLSAQNKITDSLSALLNNHMQEDTTRVILLNKLAREYLSTGSDKTLSTANAALQLAKKINYTAGEILALERTGNFYQSRGDYQKALDIFTLEKQAALKIKDSITIAWISIYKGVIYQSQSNYPLALQEYLDAVKIFENTNDKEDAASAYGNIGVLYQDMEEPVKAQKYYEQGLKIHEDANNKPEIIRFLNNLGGVYKDQTLYQQSEAMFTRALSLAEETENTHYIALVSRNIMDVKMAMKNYAEAFPYGFHSLKLYKSMNETEGVTDVSYLIAQAYAETNKPDSAILFANTSLKLAKEIGFTRNIFYTYGVLAKAYALKKNFEKAYAYESEYSVYKDSLNGVDRKNTMAAIKFQYDLDKKQSEILLLTKDKQIKEQEVNRQRIKSYAYLACFILVALLAAALTRNNIHKQKANKLLQQEKKKVEDTLSELKATQSQLIQREKMASLGELTAGIAHEIQNPLNFVNNFSEVNSELIEEMKQELATGNTGAVITIADDIKQNLERINQHGKRADAIVKNMLQHSRKHTGQKEPTNINALCDEYLRLSYHGLRAKDKSFTADFKTNFDETIDKINIVPQDIGRVLLNLFNNAFYAVNEKLKANSMQLAAGYKPLVSVQTKRLNNKIEIVVSDNGNGIQQNIIDKIFQPFFTTKPAGQGTGLGLSLSYDIITKEHNGTINAESEEGKGTTFTMQLPLKQA